VYFDCTNHLELEDLRPHDEEQDRLGIFRVYNYPSAGTGVVANGNSLKGRSTVLPSRLITSIPHMYLVPAPQVRNNLRRNLSHIWYRSSLSRHHTSASLRSLCTIPDSLIFMVIVALALRARYGT